MSASPMVSPKHVHKQDVAIEDALSSVRMRSGSTPERGGSSPELSALGSPAGKRNYCKRFMMLMEHEPSRKSISLDQFVHSDETRLRSAAFIRYMQRYGADFVSYRASRECRRDELEQDIKERRISEGDAQKLRADLYKRESAYLRLRRTRMKIKDFQLLSLIGKGGYGEVFLCRKVETGEVLCLKRMKKNLYLSKNEGPRVQTERNILAESVSPWIIKLTFSFQDNEFLYLVMEYAAGGDLKTLLENLGNLDEDMAQFYFAEMVLCIEYLHQLGVTHRDLKPGNFVIDKSGHLKLIDFGLSKEGVNSRLQKNFQMFNTMRTMSPQKSYTAAEQQARYSTLAPSRNNGISMSMVGSPEYMAPEVLLGEGYDEKVDIWALGACFFEMIVGVTPFASDSVDKVFQNVLDFETTVVRPTGPGAAAISDEAWDLVTKLLCDESVRPTIKQIKAHPFFKGLDWASIRKQEAPFQPRLDDDLDTSYFNTEALEEDNMEASLNALIEADPKSQMHFPGFTFKRFE